LPIPELDDKFYFIPSANETIVLMAYTLYTSLRIYANIESLQSLPSDRVLNFKLINF